MLEYRLCLQAFGSTLATKLNQNLSADNVPKHWAMEHLGAHKSGMEPFRPIQ